MESRNSPTNVRRSPIPILADLDSGARRARAEAGGGASIGPVEKGRKITCPGDREA
jgi:hypothetical protein